MIRDSVRVRWLLTVRRIRIDRGPAWPRSPSASVAIDWDVAVTLARPSFQPLYAALYCGAGGDGVHGVATYFGLMPRIEDSNNLPAY